MFLNGIRPLKKCPTACKNAHTEDGRERLLRAVLPFQHRPLYLVRKYGEVADKAIKHLALGFVGCEIADQGSAAS
jgi:hypothetical protein